MCVIPNFLKAKDLQQITGKSNRQARRDFTEIKTNNGKAGRKCLVTYAEVSQFYGLTENEIKQKLNTKTQ